MPKQLKIKHSTAQKNQQLKSKQLSGPDNSSIVVLKTCARAIAPFISELINNSSASKLHADMLKNAIVKPLYKSGCYKDLNNYRPISLSKISEFIIKIIERVTQRRWYSYLEKMICCTINNLVSARGIAP